MSTDFTKAAEHAVGDAEGRDAYKHWVASRIETIHKTVTAHDILRRNGVRLRYGDRIEQISCPFHGKDNKPSARVYAETISGPSGVWCYVCQERWDAIKLWRKFNDFTGSFTALLRDIELAYGISPPESPMEHYADFEAPDTYAIDEVQTLIHVAEHRLVKFRRAFDMVSFLRLGVAIDRVRHHVEKKTIPLSKAREVLLTVVEKVGAKVRACPED